MQFLPRFCLNPVSLRFSLIMILTALFTGLTFFSCNLPMYGNIQTTGSIDIALDSGNSEGTRSITPVSYVFSGIGPQGDEFSVIAGETGTSVDNLKAGTWTIRGEGRNEEGDILVAGETSLNVEPYSVNQANLNLAPLPGFGSLRAAASWNALHTVAPSAEVTLTNAAGEVQTRALTVTGPGAAEGLVSNLATGNYHAAIKIYDSGVLITGSAWTVRVLKDLEVEVMAQFDMLNKVGERIEIADDEFTVAWDSDPADPTPEEYRMYYRHRGEYDWVLLSSVFAQPEPQFTVSRDILSYGTYEFAVSAVAGGSESDLHTSMDDTADPESGWYVDWLGV